MQCAGLAITTQSGQHRKENPMQLQNDYFASYRSLKLTRDAHCVLVVEFHTKGGPFRFTGDLRVAQGKPFLISWSAVDADGDALTYMVMASLDGGRSWNLLQLSTRNTSVTVPTKVFARRVLPGGGGVATFLATVRVFKGLSNRS